MVVEGEGEGGLAGHVAVLAARPVPATVRLLDLKHLALPTTLAPLEAVNGGAVLFRAVQQLRPGVIWHSATHWGVCLAFTCVTR